MTTTDISWNGRHTDPQQLVSTPQTVGTAWADLGSEYKLAGARTCAIYANVDINDATNMRVRFLAKHASAHADEFVIPIRTISASDVKVEDSYIEFNTDADQNMILSADLDGCVMYGQWQVQVATGTAAQIDDAWLVSAI